MFITELLESIVYMLQNYTTAGKGHKQIYIIIVYVHVLVVYQSFLEVEQKLVKFVSIILMTLHV